MLYETLICQLTTPKAVALAQEILEHYNSGSVEDMDETLKEIFGPLFESMLQGELNSHLGYKSNSKEAKTTANRRNGYGSKSLKTTRGEMDSNVPRDRDASFEPKLIPEHLRDVSAIENKVLAMYARGMSQRDISNTTDDIYGFSISADAVSDITDSILPELENWQTRPLEKCYVFMFVDCMYVTIRSDYEAKEYAVYTILGYNLKEKKEMLGLQYPGAVGLWVRNFQHVEQLYDYGASIRKIMYTTKKGTFPNENALLKILYLRVKELDQKWSSGNVPN